MNPKLKEMKAFFPVLPTILLCLTAKFAWAAGVTTVSGPWTELRQAPLFEAQTQPLSKNWGPALPVGQDFKVEKIYGRWLYGTPSPLPRMPAKEFAQPGWVFSRMLLLPGDEDTLPPALVKQSRAVIYHGREAWKKLDLGKPPLFSPLDFLEGLTLSRGTLNAFRRQDEAPLTYLKFLPPLFPAGIPSGILSAVAAEEKAPSMGLTGTDLQFLDQEFKVLQDEKKTAEQKRLALKLKPPGTPALDQSVRTAVLGRFLLQKYLTLPPLTHEEVDGFVYMRATAMRALEGCPKDVRDYWQNRRWNLVRVYRMKSRTDVAHPWLEVALPGGYFAFSAKAIETAGNEAELAFLLVRPLVRELRLERQKVAFQPKAWPGQLNALSEQVWDQTLRAQSTKESANLDVADEIAVDIAATECISRAGYRPMGGLSYLRKLAMKKEEPWAKWFFDHSIGLEYRMERLGALLEDALAKEKFPEGKASNPKRFSTASRHWNLLP